MALAATTSRSITLPDPVQFQDHKQQINLRNAPVQIRIIICSSRVKRASMSCAAALNATCAAGQTQTVTRQSSTIIVAPVQGKEKSPDLDSGGTGLFSFGFLRFLKLLKDEEEDGPYKE